MAERIKQTALDEAQHLRTMAQQGVESGAYLYPIKGLVYYLTHRALWRPLLSRLPAFLGLAFTVTVTLFLTTYVPQAAALTFVSGPFVAPFAAAMLVLSESAAVSVALGKGYLVGEALLDTFDGTLLSLNMPTLVAPGRDLNKNSSDPIGRLGQTLKRLPGSGFSTNAVIRYLLHLPLNLIPGVGTALFILMQGRASGPASHERYFQLKGLEGQRKSQFVEDRKAAYTSFGLVAVLLEMIPVAGVLFSFTNTVGAALWAADLERSGTTAPGLREQAKKAD